MLIIPNVALCLLDMSRGELTRRSLYQLYKIKMCQGSQLVALHLGPKKKKINECRLD